MYIHLQHRQAVHTEFVGGQRMGLGEQITHNCNKLGSGGPFLRVVNRSSERFKKSSREKSVRGRVSRTKVGCGKMDEEGNFVVRGPGKIFPRKRLTAGLGLMGLMGLGGKHQKKVHESSKTSCRSHLHCLRFVRLLVNKSICSHSPPEIHILERFTNFDSSI